MGRYLVNTEEKARKAAYMKRWRANNPQRIAQQRAKEKALRPERRDELNARRREQYHAAPDAIRARNRAWRSANTDAVNAGWERYRARNKELIAERRKSAAFVLSNRMRSRMHKVIDRKKAGRSWTNIVGYGWQELKDHIERQFQRGMSWSNIGEWHIDHIVPLSSFSFTGPNDPEFKRAWALANLRPLWADENLAKSARVETLL